MDDLSDDFTADLFFDALDTFPFPDSHQILEPTTNFQSESIAILTDSPPKSSLCRRRPSTSRSISNSLDPSSNSTISTPIKRESEILLTSESADISNYTLASDQTASSSERDNEIPAEPPIDAGSPLQSLLFSIAGLVIKATFFQINLLISCFTLPVRLFHFWLFLLIDPIGTLKRAKDGFWERFGKVRTVLVNRVSLWVSERPGNQQGVGNLVARLALGFFWSLYVGFVLLGILSTAFLVGSLLMRWVVEEPIRLTEDLNFDYTKPSPVALVPLDSHGGFGCHFDGDGKSDVGKHLGGRVVPLNHKLLLTVSLTLPESEYNRKLGMFQIRAELLSSTGRVTYSSSQPCMLQFKSSHVRLLETFLKSGILLAGYSSESQILSIKIRGFIEGTEPTTCVRVILEQRAEYRPGAGIPEIYAASLKLESELPMLKRLIWYWRRTVFIWVVMGLFVLELLIILVCCRPVIIPWPRTSI